MNTITRIQPGKDSTTIASWTRFVIAGLHLRGLDTDKLLREAGIAKSDMDNPNHRISVSNMTQLWELAASDSADPCFALGLADTARADMFSGLGLAIMFSSTAGEAIQRLCRYSSVASNAAHLEAVPGSEGTLEIRFHLHIPVAGEAMEAFMACGVGILRQITHDRFRPLEVHFSHDKSAYRTRFEDFFEAPVVFNALICKLVVDGQMLALPCYQSNSELAHNIEVWMNEYLERHGSFSLADRVRKLLLAGISNGDVEQSAIAGSLGMSTRVLQRGLKQEGYSFRELLETAHREMAEGLLLQSELSLTEICYLLGFSDQSNFTKAFKRWTGQTPSGYRMSLQ